MSHESLTLLIQVEYDTSYIYMYNKMVAGQNGDTPERRHTYHRNGDASITKTATNQIGDNDN